MELNAQNIIIKQNPKYPTDRFSYRRVSADSFDSNDIGVVGDVIRSKVNRGVVPRS